MLKKPVLNKKLCKLCYKNSNEKWRWLENECWKGRWVHCLALGDKLHIATPTVPISCKYYMEHKVLTQ